jgi:TPR repeat protein
MRSDGLSRRISLWVLAALSVAACSATPGDAARRGSHFEQAATLYEAGAKRGDPLAAQKLGHLYNLRPGLPENHERAVHWYKRAIELGDIPSNWFLGVIYRDGTGNVPRNDALAEDYFLQGAQKGQHYSMYDLASLYAENRTRESNDVQGLMWLEIVTAFAASCPASNEGCQYVLRDPKGVRATLTGRMNPDQRHTAKMRADGWMKDWRRKQE